MNLFYREKGNSENPPLLIFHGLWGASDNWLQVATQLAEHFHVILPDLRNHGRSPHFTAMDYEDLSEDLFRFIGELQLPQKPFLAGHSMGGKALMTLLSKYPNIAPKAAVLDIAPRSYSPEQSGFHLQLLNFMSQFPIATFRRHEELRQEIRRQLRSEALCQIIFKNIRKSASNFEWKVNIHALQEHLDDLLSWSIPSGASLYPFPLLFIKGENSPYLQVSDLHPIRTLFPHADLISLPGASHYLHAETPELLAQTLTDFFLPSK